jgi:DNA-binding PadR family transcriptional regulator
VSLRHAILGFVELEPASGYTLRQRFEGSVRSFWSATQSQIYRELHDLEREGLVQVEVVPQPGKPARKVYSITGAGRDELGGWLLAPVEPATLRDPFLLKFVFGASLPPASLDAHLASIGTSLEATRLEYRARLGHPRIFSLARSEREKSIWRLSLENGLAWCDAQLAWVARARLELGGPKAAPAQKGKPVVRAGSKRPVRSKR